MGPTTAARTFSPVSAAAVRLHGHSHQPLAPTPPAPTTVAAATIAAPEPCSRPRPCHRRGGLALQLSPPPTSPPLTPARATPPALPRPLPPPPPQPRRSSAPACPITDAAAAETRPPLPDRCPRHHNSRGCRPPKPSPQRTPAPLTPARAPPTAAPATTTAASLGGGVAGGIIAVAPPPLQGGGSPSKLTSDGLPRPRVSQESGHFRAAHAFLSGSPQGRKAKSSSDWASIILTPMARPIQKAFGWAFWGS